VNREKRNLEGTAAVQPSREANLSPKNAWYSSRPILALGPLLVAVGDYHPFSDFTAATGQIFETWLVRILAEIECPLHPMTVTSSYSSRSGTIRLRGELGKG
jgi:hypothetical protein